MPQYDLIVPSGEAVLVDRATGVRLRLSAESGPLRLGSVTLDFAVEPKGLNASSGQPGEAAGAQTAPLSVPTVSQDCGLTAPDRRLLPLSECRDSLRGSVPIPQRLLARDRCQLLRGIPLFAYWMRLWKV